MIRKEVGEENGGMYENKKLLLFAHWGNLFNYFQFSIFSIQLKIKKLILYIDYIILHYVY